MKTTAPFRRALLASLLAHGGLFAVLGQLPTARPPASVTPLQVRLHVLRPAEPERMPDAAEPGTAPAAALPLPVPNPSREEDQTVRTKPAQPDDWMSDAQAVIREWHEPSSNGFLPPPVETGSGLRDDIDDIPVIATAFRPVPRPKKICGKVVEIDLGVRVVSIPTTYACEDKQEEFRNAPGAGRNTKGLSGVDDE